MPTLTDALGVAGANLAAVIEAFAAGCATLAEHIANPYRHVEQHGKRAPANTSGDTQHNLDATADIIFINAFKAAPVAWLVSEEQPQALRLNNRNECATHYAVAIDPLDGSSNIDANGTIGSIVGIYQACDDPLQCFSQKGDRQLAAAIAVYGPRTQLWLTTGKGTQLFVLDKKHNTFVLASAEIQIPRQTNEFAINVSNYRHWSSRIQRYVDLCLEGTEGERAQNFNMRWLASMVGEAARIFHRGGIFWYPADQRKGYAHGRLRMLYEALPVAMLVEQAGGQCCNEAGRLLDQQADSLHQRTGLLFGSYDEVAYARHMLTTESIETQSMPLFGKRSLFHSGFSSF